MEKSMKNLCTLCLIALLSLGYTVSLQAQKSDGTEKTVAALEQQWMQSQKTNNTELLAPLLAEKFINTGRDGKVTDRAATLANAKATKYDVADYQDLKVTVFGNTAIATGGFIGKGTDPTGKAFENHERWTDTWVKMPGGKWQCVASHGSTVS
jgi:ketosteroid isomerase-like protein